MPVRQYANAPATTLANSCTSLATSITVASTTGLPITFPYTLIIDRGLATEEAVSVTAAAGTTLTVTRGIDSTTAFAHAQAAVVVHGITAQDIREANAHVNASSGVHGATGSVVGTTDTQTLTNKTLNLTSNTLTATKAQINSAVSNGDPVWADEIGLYQAYAPTVTTTNRGAGTISGRYCQVGKRVHFYVKVVLGAGFSMGSSIDISLPVNAAAGAVLCSNQFFVDVGNNFFQATATLSATVVTLFGLAGVNGAYTGISSTSPFTWSTSDEIYVSGYYEAA